MVADNWKYARDLKTESVAEGEGIAQPEPASTNRDFPAQTACQVIYQHPTNRDLSISAQSPNV